MIASALARAAAGVASLARGLRMLTGWRRALTAALLGVAAAAALPPFHVMPLVVVGFTCLVWLIDGAERKRAAFAIGWWFGLGHFVAGLYWIANALLVDARQFAWMIPFAVVGLSAGLAVLTGLATLATWPARRRGVASVLALALAWSAAEWLRGHVLTGFPWNLIATIWTSGEAMMQSASLVGAYGLGLVSVAIVAMPAVLGHGGRGLHRWTGVLAALAALIGLWSWGHARLGEAEESIVAGVRLRLVQPNVEQSLKWDPERREGHFQRLLDLSRAPGWERATHIIWPEAAVPFALANEPDRLIAVASVTPPSGATLTGSPRAARTNQGIQVWNSLHAVDPTGGVVATFDKFHLVPFGEYVPLRDILPIAKITPGTIDFSAGPGPGTIVVPGLPAISPVICYEVIFPGRVSDPARRPGMIVNLTNDAWFGMSSGPYQHFAAARLRAVEEGLPLVRAANSGISGIIDGHGRVVARLELGRDGVLDADLPRALEATIYARWGDLAALVLALTFAMLALVVGRIDARAR
jgi:apolipoprotein N-acyltransferase